jgi:hypothetical protein
MKLLKDNIKKNFEKLTVDQKDDKMSEDMNMKMRGEVEVWAYDKDGKLIHHDKDHNVVTNWAKQATMHLMTGEVFTTHGDRDINDTENFSSRARRSSEASDHILGSVNNDGTLVSGEQFLGDNSNYPQYWSDNTVVLNPVDGDNTDEDFHYPFFPTKMLFGTGVEYKDWQAVIDDGKDGNGQDGYANPANGGWSEVAFDDVLTTTNVDYSNYYSTVWDGTGYKLLKSRTLNDVYAGSLSNVENPLDEDSFGVKGAIKDATFNGQNGLTVLAPVDNKYFATGSYKGIGQPAFIYAKRASRFMQAGDVELNEGQLVGTEHLESRITFTVTMPKQDAGEFYPYNGYTIKQAGIFADAAMLLRNSVPADETDNDDINNLEYINYVKQPCGIMWATRNIAPIFKTHDTEIVVQWTIYL